jgi:hypothetical protein
VRAGRYEVISSYEGHVRWVIVKAGCRNTSASDRFTALGSGCCDWSRRPDQRARCEKSPTKVDVLGATTWRRVTQPPGFHDCQRDVAGDGARVLEDPVDDCLDALGVALTDRSPSKDSEGTGGFSRQVNRSSRQGRDSLC